MPSEAEAAVRAVLVRYGLDVATIRPAGGTAGRAWRVSDVRGGDWFVRRRGARTSSPERLRFDHGLREHLAAAGFRATPAQPTQHGERWVTRDEGVYELYPWVPGHDWRPELGERARESAAAALAELHLLALDYDAVCEPLLPQFGHYDPPLPPRPTFDEPDVLLAAIDQVAEQYATAEQRDSVARARGEVEAWAAAYAPLRARLPRQVIHGDYNICNLRFDDSGSVVGVFDYDWAWRDRLVRDIGEGMFFFGARRQQPPDSGSIWSLTACPDLDTAAMAKFVKTYARNRPLSADELAAVPLAMLGRWIACRTEGVMKVPVERRVEFLLAAFGKPFEWLRDEGAAWREAVV